MSPSHPVGGPSDAGQMVDPTAPGSSLVETDPPGVGVSDPGATREHTFSLPEADLAGATEEPAQEAPEVEGLATNTAVAVERLAANAAAELEATAAEVARATPEATVPRATVEGLVETAGGEALPSVEDSLDTAGSVTLPRVESLSTEATDQPVRQIPRGSDMRARLLERAAAARRSPERHGLSSKSEGALEDVGRSDPRTRDFDLDVFGPVTPRPPSAPSSVRPRGQLSPNLVAAFGALLGLATIATIVALAMRINATPWLGLSGAAVAQAPAATEPKKAAAQEAPPSKKRVRQKLPGPWRIRDVKGRPGGRIVEGKVGRDPFLRSVQAAGVPSKQAYRVLTAFKGVKDLDSCKRTDSFIALIDSASSRIKAFEYIVTPEEVYQAREGQDGLLRGKRLDLQIRRDRVQGAFVLDGSGIDAAAERGGLEASFSDALAEALEGHMSLAELERGDRVRVIAQEVTVLGEFSRYAGIEAVEVKHAEPELASLRVYYFRGSKSRGHYDDQGRAPYEGGWRVPVKGAPVTSPFDLKRLHPILKRVMPHMGVDYGAEAGAPVGASSFGTISFMAWAGATGNLVKIEHPGKVETGYAHLSRFAEDLSVGDKVRRMQVIGYVGSTGRSTGPHLHFMAKRDGRFIDPQSLNLDGMRVLPEDERAEFAKACESYNALLQAIPWPEPLPPAAPPPGPQVTETATSAPEDAEGPEDTVGGGMEEGPMPTDSAKQSSPPAGDHAPAPPAKSAPSSTQSVYLTDKELMEKQPLSDDGEVTE